MKHYPKIKRYLALMIVGCLFCGMVSFSSIAYFDEKLKPYVQSIAQAQTQKVVANILNRSILHVSSNYEFKIDEESYQLDTKTINEAMSEMITVVKAEFTALENGDISPIENMIEYEKGIIYRIPIFSLLNMGLLASLGPSIPIKIRAIDSASTRLDTKVEAYGYNSALVKVSVVVGIFVQIVVPYLLEPIYVECEKPLLVQIISGKSISLYPTNLK